MTFHPTHIPATRQSSWITDLTMPLVLYATPSWPRLQFAFSDLRMQVRKHYTIKRMDGSHVMNDNKPSYHTN